MTTTNSRSEVFLRQSDHAGLRPDDDDLGQLINRWHDLPNHIKCAIRVLVLNSEPTLCSSSEALGSPVPEEAELTNWWGWPDHTSVKKS